MQALAASCEELRARTGKPPLVLTEHFYFAEILSTLEISSATRNTRGRRCTRGGFFKIASWYTRAGLRGTVGWSREDIEILILI